MDKKRKVKHLGVRLLIFLRKFKSFPKTRIFVDFSFAL